MEVITDLVSTIIPVFNRPKLLKEAIESVLAQTYRPIEIIIVDDGSTDRTYEVAEELAAQYPKVIKVIHKRHEGHAGLAREAGRLVAKGEYIQYLDSDDLLLPRKFEVQVRALRENQDSGIAYCYTRRYMAGENPKNIYYKRTGETIRELFPGILKGRLWHICTPLFRREVCDKGGPWSDLLCEEDWEYESRIAMQDVKLCHCKEFLADVIDHNVGRLSGKALFNPQILKERQKAYRLIYEHARNYGITYKDPNMQFFSRFLFLISRQCGAAGLEKESEECFNIAREACGRERANGWDFYIYRLAAFLLGWKLTGKLSCFIFDRFRNKTKQE
jgi:glycosyltransferase involved in cell wall biosynthesis